MCSLTFLMISLSILFGLLPCFPLRTGGAVEYLEETWPFACQTLLSKLTKWSTPLITLLCHAIASGRGTSDLVPALCSGLFSQQRTD